MESDEYSQYFGTLSWRIKVKDYALVVLVTQTLWKSLLREMCHSSWERVGGKRGWIFFFFPNLNESAMLVLCYITGAVATELHLILSL